MFRFLEVGLKAGNFWAVSDSPVSVGDCLWVVLIVCCDALDSTNELSDFIGPCESILCYCLR